MQASRAYKKQVGLMQMAAVEIGVLELDEDASGLDTLAAASVSEEYVFLRRLQSEWRSGDNRFNKPGEFLLGATATGRVVGICGVNQDPYTTDLSVARLRHLYVEPGYRNNRIGFRLVEACLGSARLNFRKIRLRMARDDTEKFYCALGFVPADSNDASHEMLF